MQYIRSEELRYRKKLRLYKRLSLILAVIAILFSAISILLTVISNL